MIQSIDDHCQIFAHIRLQIPGLSKKLGIAVVEIGGDYIVQIAFAIEIVKFIESVGEQSEGAADDDLGGFALLQFSGSVQHALAGGNHVIDDDDGLSRHIASEKFVRYDGVASVNNGGIIAAFVEHAHIHA